MNPRSTHDGTVLAVPMVRGGYSGGGGRILVVAATEATTVKVAMMEVKEVGTAVGTAEAKHVAKVVAKVAAAKVVATVESITADQHRLYVTDSSHSPHQSPACPSLPDTHDCVLR